MYGREANCPHLLEHTNLAMLSDVDGSDDEVVDEFSPELGHPEEWIEPLMKARSRSNFKLVTIFAKSNFYKNMYSITK